MEMNNSSPAKTVAGRKDIIVEILLRVPAQTLITFKCVSKQWLSLISSPDFCHRHTLRNPNSTISGVFICSSPGATKTRCELVSVGGDHRRSQPPFSSLNFASDAGGITILRSCNGLLLCGSACLFRHFRNYYVYNPTTKQFWKLPPLVGVDESVWILGANLAFDPSKSPHYKVVCIRNTGEYSRYYQIEIYSSEKRCWKACGEPFEPPFDIVLGHGVFWNGAVRWYSSTGEALSVDVEKEYFTMVKKSCGGSWHRQLWESRGHIHLIQYNIPSLRFNVCELGRDKDGWYVKYEVDLDGILTAFPEMVREPAYPHDPNIYAFVILSLVREENDEDSSLLLHIPGKVLSYKFKDKSFKKIYELESNFLEPNGSFGWIGAYHYIKTLACV